MYTILLAQNTYLAISRKFCLVVYPSGMCMKLCNKAHNLLYFRNTTKLYGSTILANGRPQNICKHPFYAQQQQQEVVTVKILLIFHSFAFLSNKQLFTKQDNLSVSTQLFSPKLVCILFIHATAHLSCLFNVSRNKPLYQNSQLCSQINIFQCFKREFPTAIKQYQ